MKNVLNIKYGCDMVNLTYLFLCLYNVHFTKNYLRSTRDILNNQIMLV